MNISFFSQTTAEYKNEIEQEREHDRELCELKLFWT
jgi:hypothetical protein